MHDSAVFRQKHPSTKYIEVLVPDINGVLRGKRLPIDQLAKLHRGELMLPRATVLIDTLGRASDNIPFGFQDGDPDSPVQPLASTLVPVPWQTRPAAQVLAEVMDETQPWPYNPTAVLRRSLRRFRQLQLTPVIAIELEFHLLQTREGIPKALQHIGGRPSFSGPQTYNVELLDEHSAFFDAVAHACSIQHIPMGSTLTEYGDGQFEINLHHTENVMQACHHACMLRRLIRGIALNHKSTATFMAKPLVGNSGNGMHVHISLLNDAGENVLSSQDLSSLAPVMQQAIAGLLQWMPDSMAIFAPNANSYQRLDPDAFAPIYADWGHDHRAVALRLPNASMANTRIEHRVAGADACPYLVVAAILSAIQDGIERQLHAPTPTEKTTVSPDATLLPQRWNRALDLFQQSSPLQNALGADFCRYYHQVKADEEAAWHRQLAQFDHLLYLRTL